MREWERVIELMEENISKVNTGFELSEIIRNEFSGEELRVPAKPSKYYIVPIVKSELKKISYEAVAEKYNLSVNTVRNYEKWQTKDGSLIAPNGKVYFLREDSL